MSSQIFFLQSLALPSGSLFPSVRAWSNVCLSPCEAELGDSGRSLHMPTRHRWSTQTPLPEVPPCCRPRPSSFKVSVSPLFTHFSKFCPIYDGPGSQTQSCYRECSIIHLLWVVTNNVPSPDKGTFARSQAQSSDAQAAIHTAVLELGERTRSRLLSYTRLTA